MYSIPVHEKRRTGEEAVHQEGRTGEGAVV